MNRDSDFNVVLLHDDFVSGIRGASILEQLAVQLEMESDELCTATWDFKGLHQSDPRKQAISRIIEAHMLIISVAGVVDLPSYIKNLIEVALSLRHHRKVALVVLLDWEGADHSELPCAGRCLQDLSSKFGLDFFCNRTARQSSAP